MRKFKIIFLKSDFGIKDHPELNPQIGDTGIIKREVEKGYFVNVTKYPSRDYFLFKDEIEEIIEDDKENH